jgi:hypothetical protein
MEYLKWENGIECFKSSAGYGLEKAALNGQDFPLDRSGS